VHTAAVMVVVVTAKVVTANSICVQSEVKFSKLNA
jgi:hypothetical protein